jgi:hypothetical protein
MPQSQHLSKRVGHVPPSQAQTAHAYLHTLPYPSVPPNLCALCKAQAVLPGMCRAGNDEERVYRQDIAIGGTGTGMRNSHLPGYHGPPPMLCPCCEAREHQSGCVRGFTCECKDILTSCYVCNKCSVHCTCEGGPERNIKRAHEKLLQKYEIEGKQNV